MKTKNKAVRNKIRTALFYALLAKSIESFNDSPRALAIVVSSNITKVIHIVVKVHIGNGRYEGVNVFPDAILIFLLDVPVDKVNMVVTKIVEPTTIGNGYLHVVDDIAIIAIERIRTDIARLPIHRSEMTARICDGTSCHNMMHICVHIVVCGFPMDSILVQVGILSEILGVRIHGLVVLICRNELFVDPRAAKATRIIPVVIALCNLPAGVVVPLIIELLLAHCGSRDDKSTEHQSDAHDDGSDFLHSRLSPFRILPLFPINLTAIHINVFVPEVIIGIMVDFECLICVLLKSAQFKISQIITGHITNIFYAITSVAKFDKSQVLVGVCLTNNKRLRITSIHQEGFTFVRTIIEMATIHLVILSLCFQSINGEVVSRRRIQRLFCHGSTKGSENLFIVLGNTIQSVCCIAIMVGTIHTRIARINCTIQVDILQINLRQLCVISVRTIFLHGCNRNHILTEGIFADHPEVIRLVLGCQFGQLGLIDEIPVSESTDFSFGWPRIKPTSARRHSKYCYCHNHS
nr:MAG TPA: hypothetical protein [Caudoviricetes sp.]